MATSAGITDGSTANHPAAVRLAVDDQQRQDASEITQTWDTVRRIREPLAWALLAIAAFIVLVSACQLYNIAGARIPIAGPVSVSQSTQVGPATPVGTAGSSPAPVPAAPSPAPVSSFDLRASSVTPQFIDAAVQGMPVLAVVLVAFAGGLTERARQVAQTAAVVLAATFVLGLISLEGAAGSHTRPGTWFILEGAGLAITAAALVFTGAVLLSGPFRSLATQGLVDEDQDFWDDDDEDFGEDA
jgi:hypothetical protein